MMISSLRQDLAFSARTLLKRPGFSLLAVFTVALGIGINTAMFTIVHGVLWKPLPYKDSERLVMFNEASASGNLNCSYPNLTDWRRKSALFEDIALAREFPPMTLRMEGSVESVPTGYAHPNLFSLLGVQPVLGRLFTDADDRPGNEPVGAITHRAWERYFASDPAVIGRRVRVHYSFQGKTAESMVIGAVLPPDFRYENIDLWLPLNRFWGQIDEARGNHWFRGIGKLKPGVTLERARADLNAIARDLEGQYPASNKDVRPIVARLIDYYTGQVRTPLLLLLGAVGFVMLIACGNVVHLLLTRTLGRSREIAVRLALGAARGRVLQLLLAESLLIALAGGALGVAMSQWGVAWAVASQPRTLPRAQTLGIDSSALIYALLVIALTFCILGLTPLWQASRANVAATLQSAGRGGTNRRQWRLSWGMVSAELAMASILLAGAGLMIQTLRNLSLVDLGYRPEGVLRVSTSLPGYKYTNQEQVEAVTENMLREMQSLPGFVLAAYAEPFQVGGNGMLPSLSIPGRTNPSTLPMIPTMEVSSDFFEALRIPLRAGSFFAKPHPAARQAIVNEEFVRRFFPGENVVGKRITMGDDLHLDIVGVVGNTHIQGPLGVQQPEVYWSSDGLWGSPTLLVRVAGRPESVAAAVRDRLKRTEPEIRLGVVRSIAEDEADRNSVQRFTRSLLLIFAVLAVVLASLGIYGVVSYSVAQRTREIGIRVALGATRATVARLVLERTLGATVVGMAAGVAGASLLEKLLATQLFGVNSHDPWIYAAVMILIGTVALVASAVPVLRASRVDPAMSLREE
jgi:predicted permease